MEDRNKREEKYSTAVDDGQSERTKQFSGVYNPPQNNRYIKLNPIEKVLRKPLTAQISACSFLLFGGAVVFVTFGAIFSTLIAGWLAFLGPKLLLGLIIAAGVIAGMSLCLTIASTASYFLTSKEQIADSGVAGDNEENKTLTPPV